MNTKEVMDLLREHQNEVGVHKWKAKTSKPGKLKSFGIGLTVLRKLAKQVGKDHFTFDR